MLDTKVLLLLLLPLVLISVLILLLLLVPAVLQVPWDKLTTSCPLAWITYYDGYLDTLYRDWFKGIDQ